MSWLILYELKYQKQDINLMYFNVFELGTKVVIHRLVISGSVPAPEKNQHKLIFPSLSSCFLSPLRSPFLLPMAITLTFIPCLTF